MASAKENPTAGVFPRMSLCPPGSSKAHASSIGAGPPLNPALERFRVRGCAIVTGGAGDLGHTACRTLLEHGVDKLAILDLESAQATTRLLELQSDFPAAQVHFIHVDVTDASKAEEAVDDIANLFGSINIVANFAGVARCYHSLEVTVEEWRRILDINTTGSFIVSRAAARKMVEAGTGGSIIFISSIAGHSVCFPQPQAAYGASKAAVLMMKNDLAAEWTVHGIRVNSISPGYMNTSILGQADGLDEAKNTWLSQNPMGRMGESDELSGALILLASNAGSYITGADIMVDGGHSLF
ncbi:hypothetical protein O1611_g7434 [Lasiodiplodia mahajangana]|uniref:Uncharacterized protein n=1 Tax=Lasiodiplodia mahajangana TaxID=1108764 RepID=A0ACC2JFH8_9PEZI|nr:hypothetical protein O1611_g7434 [Lasiodiplodia mahajangana]